MNVEPPRRTKACRLCHVYTDTTLAKRFGKAINEALSLANLRIRPNRIVVKILCTLWTTFELSVDVSDGSIYH